MSWRRATLIVAGSAGIVALLAGCASVKSTAIYYKSIQDYPAKSPDIAIPILTGLPGRPFKVSDGWPSRAIAAGIFCVRA